MVRSAAQPRVSNHGREYDTRLILQLDVAFGDHLLPLLELGLENLGALLRGGAAWFDADLGERRLDVRVRERGDERTVELGEHVGWHPRRRKDAEPQIN